MLIRQIVTDSSGTTHEVISLKGANLGKGVWVDIPDDEKNTLIEQYGPIHEIDQIPYSE